MVESWQPVSQSFRVTRLNEGKMNPARVKMSPHDFSATASERLVCFLQQRGQPVSLAALTPDASTREYFRVGWGGGTAVAAVYPEPFEAASQPFLDVTNVFRLAGVPVPDIYAVDEARGIILQEDFGDRQLYAFNQRAGKKDRERLQSEAIELIARIQKATEAALAQQSCASQLSFDVAKLSWELEFFCEHFFGSLRREKLPFAKERRFRDELSEVAEELAARPKALCHRDFHAGNLMVGNDGHLRVIDYQDARQGPASYDLVSLLLDRVTALPSLAAIRAGRLSLLREREKLGLALLDPEEFAAEFRLMTIQRGLKAVGTFSFQTGVRGRGEVYGGFIQPMLELVIQATEWLERFPAIRAVLKQRVADVYK